jgi:hypothetical protein
LAGHNRIRPAVISRNDNGPYTALIEPRLRARGFAAQQTEAAIGVPVLNRMLVAGRPNSDRHQPVIA